MNEDQDFRDAIKGILKKKVLDFIKDADLDSLVDEPLDGIDFNKMIEELFESDENVQLVIKTRIIELITEKVNDLDDLDEFVEGDFCLFEYLPEGYFDDCIKRSLTCDDFGKENSILAVLQNTIETAISRLDSDDIIPDWEEFIDRLNLKDVIGKVVIGSEIQKELEKQVTKILDERLENLEEEDLPEDYLELLGLKEKVAKLVNADTFDKAISDSIAELLPRELKNGRVQLWEIIIANPKLREIFSRVIDESLSDFDFQLRLKELLKQELSRQSLDGGKILNSLIVQISQSLLDLLLKNLGS